MPLWAGSPGRELACRWWKGGSWTQVSFLFGLGSVLSDFVALMGPSTNHPQTAGKSMNYGRGIIGLKRQNAILMGPVSHVQQKLSDLSNRATKLRAHTRSQVSQSKALQRASPPTVSAEASRVPIPEGWISPYSCFLLWCCLLLLKQNSYIP